jgi:nicotinamide-nucleotide amidase
MIKTVTIIATGEELLQGTTADTNSSFLSSRFFGTNFEVKRHITVGDSIDDIIDAVLESLNYSDIVITTGGLGPTDDDNTVEALCRIFKSVPVHHENSKRKMEKFFSALNIKIRDSDYKMISLPENSKPVDNPKGLAPGFILTSEGKIVIALPGVPDEMMEMFDNNLTGYLEEIIGFSKGMELSYKICGIRESEVNRIINEMALPDDIKWGISAKQGLSDLVFISRKEIFINKNEIDSTIKDKFKEYLLEKGFNSPEEELIYLLREAGKTISTAESCTGGLIGKRITDVPGSSDVYTGTITAYSNSIKTEFLGVNPSIIEKFGAVSEEAAGEMARGAAEMMGTTTAIATTGIAGPGGGTEEKPVGTVCFGFYIDGIIETVKLNLGGNRERIRNFSGIFAVNYLRKYLKGIR